MESIHRARLTWQPDEGDSRAHTIELGSQALAASSAPEYKGDPDKADPEEMLVGSLSSCHMLWFVALAKAKRLGIVSYEDDAEGTLDGTRFTGVTLRPRVTFDDGPDEETIRDLHHRAHERCFISNSVNFPVTVEPQGLG
ncbi:MAG TPA: OsmC family protein [Solirubrobacterales bacterium]